MSLWNKPVSKPKSDWDRRQGRGPDKRKRKSRKLTGPSVDELVSRGSYGPSYYREPDPPGLLKRLFGPKPKKRMTDKEFRRANGK